MDRAASINRESYPTTERGPNFAVDGLAVVAGDADGMVGEYQFPSVAGFGDDLREDAEDEALGMPRDLGEPAGIDLLDHAGNYVLLPGRVRLRWQGVSGQRELVMETMLCDR